MNIAYFFAGAWIINGLFNMFWIVLKLDMESVSGRRPMTPSEIIRTAAFFSFGLPGVLIAFLYLAYLVAIHFFGVNF